MYRNHQYRKKDDNDDHVGLAEDMPVGDGRLVVDDDEDAEDGEN